LQVEVKLASSEVSTDRYIARMVERRREQEWNTKLDFRKAVETGAAFWADCNLSTSEQADFLGGDAKLINSWREFLPLDRLIVMV